MTKSENSGLLTKRVCCCDSLRKTRRIASSKSVRNRIPNNWIGRNSTSRNLTGKNWIGKSSNGKNSNGNSMIWKMNENWNYVRSVAFSSLVSVVISGFLQLSPVR